MRGSTAASVVQITKAGHSDVSLRRVLLYDFLRYGSTVRDENDDDAPLQ